MSLPIYWYRVGIAIDQLLNTVLGGYPDETLSSRWGRTRYTSKVARIGCTILDHVDHLHCEVAEEFDLKGYPDSHHSAEYLP